MLRRRRDWAFQTNTDKDDGGGMEMGSTQSDDDSNDGDGSECDSKDDEGGDTEQFMSTFRLEAESDIDEEEDFDCDSLWILHDNDKDTFFNTQINAIASRDVNEGLLYL